jgi:beta-galactosidase
VFQGVVDHLRAAYGDVETLNDRWGLTYWSHRVTEWSQLWTPDGNTTPS